MFKIIKMNGLVRLRYSDSLSALFISDSCSIAPWKYTEFLQDFTGRVFTTLPSRLSALWHLH